MILCEQISDILLAGDLNIDWPKESFYKQQIERCLNENGIRQIVNNFTRVTQNTRTIIDYVIKYSNKISVHNIYTNKISGHEIIDIVIESEHNDDTESCVKEVEIFKYDK